MSAEARPPERIFARDQWIVAACLIAAAALAWWWLARPEAMQMAPPRSADYFAATFTMWALMMVAMMLPSASPMILLYARVARHHFGASAGAGVAVFALAYVVVWSAFSLAAAAAQALLVESGLVGAMSLRIGDNRLAGALLIAAALYQLTPLKAACLDNCRSPMTFLSRGVRPGAAAALRLGLTHGLYCLGCCWALMLLLFAGGVMNLAWVAVLALVVAAEKLLPLPALRLVLAGALMLGGAAMLIAGWG